MDAQLLNDEFDRDDLTHLIDVLANTFSQANLATATTLFATQLARRFHCERVSIGFLHGQHMQVQALSDTPIFEKKTKTLNDIAAAMDEAHDQCMTVQFNKTQAASDGITYAHEKLTSTYALHAVCTILLTHHGETYGAVTLERKQGELFNEKEIQFIELFTHLASSFIYLKKREDRNLFEKVKHHGEDALEKLVGPQYLKTKVISALMLLFLLFIIIFKSDYRITTDAALEGSVQRVLAAPMDGFISEIFARPGDVMEAGSVLAKLDDKELLLENTKLKRDKNKMVKEYRQALAEHDKTKAGIAHSKLKQIKAKLELVHTQIMRLDIKSPFRAVVIEGDLDKELGSPIEKGKVLFKVAPLDEYRVLLKVDETDISEIKIGQTGLLTLTSMPNMKLKFQVTKITPISTPKNGKNYFRVEANLDQKLDFLRPGMEGIAKIEIERRRIFWIWTHKFFDWAHLWLWKHLT